MTTKHTPGPLIICGDGLIEDSRGTVVADVNPSVAGPKPTAEERDAYANLFSAAPDLLAALRDLLEHEGETEVSGIGTEHPSEALEAAQIKARAAIAKAEGR